MAGDWIKMRAALFTHPKVIRMTSALKADTLRTVGGLMSVWCLFDAHSIDGRLDGYTPEVLDDHLRWPGFSKAMIDVGWLESDGAAGLDLPRFDTHNGQSAKRRAQETERKRNARKVSASEADKKRTREEKRREELKEEIHTSRVNNCDEQKPLEPVGSASPEGSASDSCPHFEILDLWKQIVPDLPQPRRSTWSDADRKMLRSRWVWFLTAKNDEGERYATTPDEALQRFAQLFEYVRDNDFLSGRSGSWRCDLRWLLQAKNFGNVLDGRYANREAA